MAVVVNRYVQALYDLTKSEKEKIEMEERLKDITNLFNSNEEFRKMLLDPRVAEDMKIEILKEIISESNQKVFINFLSLLIKENRINLLEEIAIEYKKLNSASRKELTIKIIVAQLTSDQQLQEIADKYKKMYKADSIKYEVEIDEELLGGVKVVVGNTVYDGSVKTQLKQMF